MMSNQKEPQEIKVHIPDDMKGGVYSNLMQVQHTREEFILTFIMVAPPTGSVTARVIMSPGHIKRTIAALQENVKKYEEKFGSITQAEEPHGKGKLGFKTG
jgi:hypothetical protein